MKRNRIGQHALAFLALVGVLLPQHLLAADVNFNSPVRIHDVALDTAGTLHGQVMDTRGSMATGLHLQVLQNGQQVAVVQTDEQGRFAVTQLRGGVYQFVSQQGAVTFRVWHHNAAPPAAQDSALIIVGQDIVRGQGPFDFISNPWFLGIGVAAAIAIPLALDDDDNGS